MKHVTVKTLVSGQQELDRMKNEIQCVMTIFVRMLSQMMTKDVSVRFERHGYAWDVGIHHANQNCGITFSEVGNVKELCRARYIDYAHKYEPPKLEYVQLIHGKLDLLVRGILHSLPTISELQEWKAILSASKQ